MSEEDKPKLVERSAKIVSATALNRKKDLEQIKKGKMFTKEEFNILRSKKLNKEDPEAEVKRLQARITAIKKEQKEVDKNASP